MSLKYKAAVFIGRFQPFHSAHLQIVDHALKIADKVIISVGSSKRPTTIKNPWTADERIEMIKTTLLDHYNPGLRFAGFNDGKPKTGILDRISFTQVRDFMYDNTEWGAEVYTQAIEAGATADKDTCIVGAFKDDSSWYLNFFPQWDLVSVPLVKHSGKVLNATDIRNEMFETQSLEMFKDTVAEFVLRDLRGWIKGPDGQLLSEQYRFLKEYQKDHAFANPQIKYKPVFVTVDTVVHKSGHILLIKRKFHPGKGLYALPGGFLDYGETVQDSAIRELKEETCIDVPSEVLHQRIVDTQIFDHPKRSDRGRTITHAYLIDLGKGPLPNIKANDDASGAHWVHIRDVAKLEAQMYEDHFDIVSRLTTRLSGRF
jgi:bifunctional NMN adenylyltransferase/nudix hydrolase